MSPPEIFLDTTIQIARFVHGPRQKKRIKERLSEYQETTSSLVVKQEFKRRLLQEAQYLLNLFHKYGSYAEVRRHVTDHMGHWHERKRNICLEMLDTIFEGRGDTDLTDRAKSSLRTLLRFGLRRFRRNVDSMKTESGCACARHQVVEKKPYRRYEFGPKECSKTDGQCGVVEFLKTRQQELNDVLDVLRDLPEDQKTGELRKAESFIEHVLRDPTQAIQWEPCLKVGDLLIALESVGVPTFYTMNKKESIPLCRALGQRLLVRPVTKPDNDDEIHEPE